MWEESHPLCGQGRGWRELCGRWCLCGVVGGRWHEWRDTSTWRPIYDSINELINSHLCGDHTDLLTFALPERACIGDSPLQTWGQRSSRSQFCVLHVSN